MISQSEIHSRLNQIWQISTPAGSGWGDFSYIAQVKDLLRQARGMVKFILLYPSAADRGRVGNPLTQPRYLL